MILAANMLKTQLGLLKHSGCTSATGETPAIFTMVDKSLRMIK